MDSMNYLVLARKWRPQRFSDVVGQEIIIKTLAKALTSGRIAHAFLLTGSRGVGKTTVARLLAKALSCESGISPDPCGVCSHCVEIAAGTSMDIVEIDGASNTGVDDVRELRDSLRYQPASARFKIFIIDEVHMLSTSAFNALLKTLEEPPPHVKFIFATTEAHKIPITILSRCQRYDFRRMPVSVIVDRLKDILRQENIQVDPEGLFLIAQNADGGMRDALSLLDQVISFSGEKASLQDVVDILGLIDQQSIQKASDAILEGHAREALSLIEAASESGWDLKQLSDNISNEFRNLCISASAGSIMGLADLTEEKAKLTDEKAKKYDRLDLQRLLSMALQATDQMTNSEQPKLVLELAFLKMADRPQLAQMTEVMQAIARLEALGPAVVSKSEPIKKIDAWANFVETVTEKMPVIGHHLEHARLIGNNQLEFDQKLHFARVQEAAADKQFF
ncbi:MAG: DNA polymerase III subunit gamma/tau, partial [Myxococcaceae bacterium]